MQSNIVSLVRGFVRLRVRGRQAESLLNRLVDERIIVWNLARLKDELEMDIHLSDFYRLRAFLKETGCRSRIIGRFGMPFWLARLERRKFWVGGAMLFALGLYVLSTIVWSVEVVGNDRISTHQVLDIADRQGIHRGAWMLKLDDTDTLSARLMQHIPEAAWISVSMHGTKVRIEMVENAVPEDRDLMNPRHLISTSDAVITEIITERGNPLVRRHMRVKKGDILISGLIGTDESQDIVVAKGEVKGLVWHEYEINVPLEQTRKVYTGNEQKQFFLVIGNRALQITGYGQDSYEHEVVDKDRKTLRWREVTLPFGWMHEHVKEMRFETHRIDQAAAREIGITQARADIIAKYGREAQIREENILHEKMDNGKVYMKVLFEVEHTISEEMPIIPIEYPAGE